MARTERRLEVTDSKVLAALATPCGWPCCTSSTPSARNALVPNDALVGANALIGLDANLARLAGSPLGGLLVATSGLPGLIIGDAASFLIGAALIGLVRRGRSGSPGTLGARGSLGAPGHPGARGSLGAPGSPRAPGSPTPHRPPTFEPALAVRGPPVGERSRNADRAPAVVHSPVPSAAPAPAGHSPEQP